MGGPRMTPDLIEKAAKVYAETGNLSESARSIGVGESTLRAAFARMKVARNRDIHARACERGLRAARKRMVRLGEMAERYTVDAVETLSIEPRDLAAVLNATARLADSLASISEREERRKQAKLARRKTKAETELIHARITGALPPDRVVVELTDDELDERIRALAPAVVPGEASGES